MSKRRIHQRLRSGNSVMVMCMSTWFDGKLMFLSASLFNLSHCLIVYIPEFFHKASVNATEIFLNQNWAWKECIFYMELKLWVIFNWRFSLVAPKPAGKKVLNIKVISTSQASNFDSERLNFACEVLWFLSCLKFLKL